MSKLLPTVSTVKVPAWGAVQLHQSDLPPELPAWFGSPDSLVALALEAETLPLSPPRVVRLEKASLLLAAVPRKPESEAEKALVPLAFDAFTR